MQRVGELFAFTPNLTRKIFTEKIKSRALYACCFAIENALLNATI